MSVSLGNGLYPKARTFKGSRSVNIDDPKWSQEGSSKGKRLRFFLRSADAPTIVKTLNALWEHRELFRKRNKIAEHVDDAHGRLREVLVHLGDAFSTVGKPVGRAADFSHVKYDVIQQTLMALTRLPPQDRGYQFERFLTKLFNAFDLEARAPFRLAGEQIDGSFMLGDQTYLVEAKWQNDLIGATALDAFANKVNRRAAWSRGLYVSYTGFSPQGIIAFGRADRVICLDGQDLAESLLRKIPLPEVLLRKARHAVERGATLARVADLF